MEKSMRTIEWKDSYSVGHAGMDQQHKKLVSLLNEFSQALSRGEGKTKLYETLMGLVEYTKKHFKDEEELMASSGFPDLDEHKAIHKQLTNKVINYAVQYNAGELTNTVELLNFLKNWLVDHIQGVDIKYGQYLAKS
jgi:hemerythrin